LSATRLGLGIDTGGTFTDAALVDEATSEVVATAKMPTTRHDLAEGITNAVKGLPAELLARVGLVSLSTTLATNAIVEGNGAPVCLVLIGYDEGLIRSYDLGRLLPTANVVYVAGGHNSVGIEREPLDEAGLRELARQQAGGIAAFAVSGFFGVRNPDHELRARDILVELTGLPVTCGHELASELDSVLRAATCALNASLVPLLRDLMHSVQRALASLDITAPLMVVRGDGSLMRVEMARERPVETILSGPAASVVGAKALTGLQDMLAVDIGGTTTDLALVRGGLPLLNERGATVGRWRTLVKAIQTVSRGLGGDSQVRLNGGERRLQVGPRRVVPLCFLASRHPQVRRDLTRLLASPELGGEDEPAFFSLVRPAQANAQSDVERRILAALGTGPRPLWRLVERDPWTRLYLSRPNALERSGSVMRAGFTPTDALHVLGAFSAWDREAALAGASLLGRRLGLEPEELAERAVAEVKRQLVRSLVTMLTGSRDGALGEEILLELALAGGGELEVHLHSHLPVIGLGAPADYFVTPAAQVLGAPLHLPRHHGVANAVGAISGSVVVREAIEVHGLYEPTGLVGYVLTGPFVAQRFQEREQAVAEARARAQHLARERALAAGAGDVEVKLEVEELEGTAAGGADKLYLGTRLLATAVGRPRFAAPSSEQAVEGAPEGIGAGG